MKTERELAQQNIAENRKAFHDYHIVESFEAGVALLGTEVKSIREGNVNLRDSFARVEAGEVWIYNVHISPYSHRGYVDHEPTRRRKLLLHRLYRDRPARRASHSRPMIWSHAVFIARRATKSIRAPISN